MKRASAIALTLCLLLAALLPLRGGFVCGGMGGALLAAPCCPDHPDGPPPRAPQLAPRCCERAPERGVQASVRPAPDPLPPLLIGIARAALVVHAALIPPPEGGALPCPLGRPQRPPWAPPTGAPTVLRI